MFRVGIYFTPDPESPLAVAAAKWLGRDIFNRDCPEQIVPPGMDAMRFKELTAAPYHYGFHGTLKPPFKLMSGVSKTEVYDAIERLASSIKPFLLPKLEISSIDNFLCLTLSQKCLQLRQVAELTVAELDHFRLPPDEQELAKRRKANLSQRQELMLLNWGYPYVMEEFRFHLTLTQRIADPVEKQNVFVHAKEHFPQTLLRAVPFNGLSVFVENNKQPMVRDRYFVFEG